MHPLDLHQIGSFQEKFVQSSRGISLRVRVPDFPGRACANVVLTHGLGEHSRRYEHVATALARSGIRLWAYDLRGHGRSGGRRGDAPGYATLLDDLAAVVDDMPAEEAPTFLMGHSLGGQITLSFLLRCPSQIRGAIVASPWLRLAFVPARWRLLLARVAMHIWPGLAQRRSTNTTHLSRDAAHLSSLPDLDLVHPWLSARLYFAVERAGATALREAPKLQTPVFLLHGEDDSVTCVRATREFYERAGVQDKQLTVYPEARHETHNDLCRDRVLEDIRRWITARAAS